MGRYSFYVNERLNIITIIHEAIHGLCAKLFGGKVIFGFKGIYAYCQEVSGKELHRTKFLLV